MIWSWQPLSSWTKWPLQPLRVVAPGAAQRAALHEDGAADAGAVIDGEFLDVENEAGRVGWIVQWAHLQTRRGHIVQMKGNGFRAEGGAAGQIPAGFVE